MHSALGGQSHDELLENLKVAALALPMHKLSTADITDLLTVLYRILHRRGIRIGQQERPEGLSLRRRLRLVR